MMLIMMMMMVILMIYHNNNDNVDAAGDVSLWVYLFQVFGCVD